MDVLAHLIDRHIDPSKYHIHCDNETATFLIYNLSGQLVGYQLYRPFAPKTLNNDAVLGRYYTYSSKHIHVNNQKTNMLAAWGLETYHYNDEFLFLTEGIFDACRIHNLNYPAIAMLSNDPKPFVSWLRTLKDRTLIAICDNDAAGRKLAKCADYAFFTDKKDLGDMTEMEVQEFISSIMKGLKA